MRASPREPALAYFLIPRLGTMRPHMFLVAAFYCLGREEMPHLVPLFVPALPGEGSRALFKAPHPFQPSLPIQPGRGVVRHGGKK